MLQTFETLGFIILSPVMILGSIVIFGGLIWFFAQIVEFFFAILTFQGYDTKPTYVRQQSKPRVVVTELPPLKMDPKEMTPPFKVKI